VTLPAIDLRTVGKRYWKIRERSLLRALVPFGAPNRTELWALHGIDLRVRPGETVGTIGRNGAGKSTLLRLLAGVTRPSTGRVVTRGRIAPLLSVGVGFHQEMTGRENVYVNGMLLGLTKREIGARFDDIVGFAELDEFIDTPVKFYSSGMFMRLGFSVAIHVDPDVLLVDEVLAVGDVGFQLRCLDRMRDLQRRGTTIVFVSHSMHAIHLLCPRTVVLHRGRIEFDGATEPAIARYHSLLADGDDEQPGSQVTVLTRSLVADGKPIDGIDQDSSVAYRTELRFDRSVESPQLFFRVLSEDGTIAYSMQTAFERWRSFSEGEHTSAEVMFRPCFGGGGTFRIAVLVTDQNGSEVLLHDQNGPSFYVPPRFGVSGVADLGATISVDGEHRTNHSPLRLDGSVGVDTMRASSS
jgi:ABC-type polysaccharide/polyol phosphate transport system ATPase subunit